MRLKLLVLYLCFFNGLARADVICSFEWELKLGVVNLGVAKDIIKRNGLGLEMSSGYFPSGFVKLLGINEINRKVEFKGKDLLARKETRLGTNKEENSWKQFNGNWVREIDGRKDEEFQIKVERFIDSLSILYARRFDILSVDKQLDVGVITKGTPYLAKIERKETDAGEEIEFRSDKMAGLVKLDKELLPYFFTFKEDGKEIVSNLKSKKCLG